MSDLPTIEPTEITAGDFVSWKKEDDACVDPSGDTCKASDGWTLTYALVLDKTAVTTSTSDLIEITASASGDDYLIELAAADTADYTAGNYHWQAYVTKSIERYMVDSGTLKVLPNFAAQSSGIDQRSHVKKVLDALEAMLERRATKDQGSIVLAGEVLAKMPIHRVMEFYDKYKAMYQQELAAERIANGLGHNRNIYTRFV